MSSVHVTAANHQTVSVEVDGIHRTITWPELKACAEQSDRELARSYASIRDVAEAVACNWYRGHETVRLPLEPHMSGAGIYAGQYVVEVRGPGAAHWTRTLAVFAGGYAQSNRPRSWEVCAHDCEALKASGPPASLCAQRIRQVSW